MNKRNIILFLLSIHLFIIHSKLLYHLNPDKVMNETGVFSFIQLNEYMIIAIISALSYSIMTALVLNNDSLKRIIIAFAIIDPIGIVIYYYVNIPREWFVIFGALYYGLYTFFIVYSFMNKSDKKVNNEDILHNSENGIHEKVLEMRDAGMTQTKIAKELKITQPKVSRILKKLNEVKN